MTANESLAIKICRVIAIFFMSYVHVSPGFNNWPEAVPSYLFFTGTVLSEFLGRASVPALSVLSGYLAFYSSQRAVNWFSYIKGRWNGLIIPLITWNVAIIVLSIAILYTTGLETFVIRNSPPINDLTFEIVLTKLTGFSSSPATYSLHFLRDVFVCSLFIPIIVMLVKKLGAFAIVIVWTIGLSLGFQPLILTSSILLFFIIGVYFASKSSQLTPSKYVLLKVFFAVTTAILLVYFIQELKSIANPDFLNNILKRLIITTMILALSLKICQWRIGKFIAQLEPLAYLFYLSHSLIIMLIWGCWQQIFGKEFIWPFFIYFLLAPIATFAVVFLLHRALKAMPSPVQKALNGKPIKHSITLKPY